MATLSSAEVKEKPRIIYAGEILDVMGSIVTAKEICIWPLGDDHDTIVTRNIAGCSNELTFVQGGCYVLTIYFEPNPAFAQLPEPAEEDAVHKPFTGWLTFASLQLF